jgi:hypothetical protein
LEDLTPIVSEKSKTTENPKKSKNFSQKPWSRVFGGNKHGDPKNSAHWIVNVIAKENLRKAKSRWMPAEGVDHVDYGILRTIKQLTSHLEVRACSEHQWQDAILCGFAAWRQLQNHRKGILVGDLERRTLEFEQVTRRVHKT